MPISEELLQEVIDLSNALAELLMAARKTTSGNLEAVATPLRPRSTEEYAHILVDVDFSVPPPGYLPARIDTSVPPPPLPMWGPGTTNRQVPVFSPQSRPYYRPVSSASSTRLMTPCCWPAQYGK